ncbi:MAG: F0F1 ATP synthase subunit gamma [Spirochaetota bacterium]
MQTLEGLKRRIQSIQELGSVVRTMKAMAAVGIRQYERAVSSLSDYVGTIEMGLQVVLAQSPGLPGREPESDERDPAAFLVLGSDQGMVGQFNDRMAAYALDHIPPEIRGGGIIAVGHRVAVKLEDRGAGVLDVLPVPGSVTGIRWTVQEILLRLDRLREEARIRRVMLFHHRPAGGASYSPAGRLLLPPDREWLQSLRRRQWLSRSLPMFRMEGGELFSALLRQHHYATLFRAVAESLASENAGRLASMQAAEKNIRDRLSELGTRYHRRRQAAVTSELLDIAAGFEALRERT